ncbi:MAG: type II toxin-antitoxin system HicB family antitoxin [Methanosarcina sp.]
MTQLFTFSAMVQKRDEVYVSKCLELEITSWGITIEDAVSNLKEAVQIHIEKENIVLPIKRPFLTTFKIAGKNQVEEEYA